MKVNLYSFWVVHFITIYASSTQQNFSNTWSIINGDMALLQMYDFFYLWVIPCQNNHTLKVQNLYIAEISTWS
jgi:hypothetical protein